MAVIDRIVRPDGTILEVRGPPYTQEEEDAFYDRYAKGMMSGQATVVHPPKVATPPATPTGPVTPRPPRPLQYKSPTSSSWESEPPYRRNLGLK